MGEGFIGSGFKRDKVSPRGAVSSAVPVHSIQSSECVCFRRMLVIAVAVVVCWLCKCMHFVSAVSHDAEEKYF